MNMASRFVKCVPHRIPLSNGDWIEVRKDLNTGEAKELENAGLSTPVRLADGSVFTPIDWSIYEIERVSIFLLDWNLKDENDKIVPLNTKDGKVDRSVIRALDPTDFEEINKAITTHILTRGVEKNAERESRKPKTEGAPVAEQISL